MKSHRSISSHTTCRKEYKIVTNDKFMDRYWDEGVNYYRSSPVNRWKRKELMMYQVRQYKSWKHNRKNQWKES